MALCPCDQHSSRKSKRSARRMSSKTRSPSTSLSLQCALNLCRTQWKRGDAATSATFACRGIPPSWRTALVEWLQMVCIESGGVVHSETVAVAVSLLDSFIMGRPAKLPLLNERHYHLLGAAVFSLAVKYNEVCSSSTRFVRKFPAQRFDSLVIASAEMHVCKALRWRLCPVSAHCIALHVIAVLMQIQNSETMHSNGKPTTTMHNKKPCLSVQSSSRHKATTSSRGIDTALFAESPMKTRLSQVTITLLDLQLSKTTTHAYPRPAIALGAVLTACHLCNVQPAKAFLEGTQRWFQTHELAAIEVLRKIFRNSFTDSFPALSARPKP